MNAMHGSIARGAAILATLCCVAFAQEPAPESAAPRSEPTWSTKLTHVSAAARPGSGRAALCASTAVIPLDASQRVDFDRQRFALYSTAGRRIGPAWTRSLSRKSDGSTLVGLAYLPAQHLANFPHAVHELELRREDGAREEPPALDPRLQGLLEQSEGARLALEVQDPAGNLYRAELPPLAALQERMPRLEWEGCATLKPVEIVDEEAALPDAGDVWFSLRALPAGDELGTGARLSVAWLNGRLEQTAYRDVYARKVHLRVETPVRWARLCLVAPWWRGQDERDVEDARGRRIALYAPEGSAALRLQHGATFAQGLLLHDGSRAEGAQTRADFEELWCALDLYRRPDALLPVPIAPRPEAALRALEKRYDDLRAQARPKKSEPALVDPFTAQLSFGVPLVRYEPTTGYQGIGTNSRFAVATAMTASPYAALLNRVHTWSALAFPVTCYRVEGGRLVFDDPARHVEGTGEHAKMSVNFHYLPHDPEGPLGGTPAAQRFGRRVSKQERVLLELVKGWKLHPEDRGSSEQVDLPHHMRSSVYGLQGNLVQACPEYALYAGAHASAFAHTLHPWKDGVLAWQWENARKLAQQSGEMPGFAHDETRSNANHLLHAAWALAADTRGEEGFAKTLRDCVAAYVECTHGIRHPRGFNFCQIGKHTLYPATDGTQVELVPILVGTYQLGWVENGGRTLLRVLRARGEDELAAKLEELLRECVELVLAAPAMIDPATGAMAFYAMGGFSGYDPPATWSLEVGERRYEVGGKTVVHDFSKGRSYSDRFEHHFTAYVQLAAALERTAPERAAQLRGLAAKSFPERFRAPERTAQQLAEAEFHPWDLPAATLVLQRR
ncbi:MAG: hypothetical protein JNM84_02390 [Planctomycetes bacterium]|nr:hypothetical protein [Planctomycetota bacterium]